MHPESLVEDLFYGAVKVGERGQVVIPAEARREHDLSPGTRLLVFRHHFGGIMLVKVDSAQEVLARMTEQLAQLAQVREETAHNATDEGEDVE